MSIIFGVGTCTFILYALITESAKRSAKFRCSLVQYMNGNPEMHLKIDNTTFFFKTVALTCLCALSIAAVAQSTYFSEGSKTVARLGVQGDIFYVAFTTPLQQHCAHLVAYIPASRKGMYSQLLVAKLTGQRISRIDYSQPAGNGTICNIELVELAD